MDQPVPAAPEPDPNWTASEGFVWERLSQGEQADLATLAPDDRVVRPATILAMLTGPLAASLPAGGVRIAGATIPGPLLLEYLSLSRPLWLERCRIVGDLSLRSTRIAGEFSLDDTTIEGDALLSATSLGYTSWVGTRVRGSLTAILARFEQSLFAPGLRCGGDVVLAESSIGSGLTLTGARIAGRLDATRLSARSVALGASAYGGDADPATVICGLLTLSGATIAGDLTLGRLILTAKAQAGPAMAASDLTVGGWVFAHGTSARAPMVLSFSKLGHLDLQNAGRRLLRVDLHGTQIGGELLVSQDTKWREGGLLDLRNARVGALQDQLGGSWPARVHMHGFVMDRLGGYGGDPASSFMLRSRADFITLIGRTSELEAASTERLWGQLPSVIRALWPHPRSAPAWLRGALVPERRDIGYRPSTWRLFAAKLRDLGRPQLADDLEYESREIERRNALFPRSVGLWLLKVTIGYGIGASRYFRAAVWALLLAGLCLVAGLIDAHALRTPLARHSLFWWASASINHVLPIVTLDKTYGDALPSGLAGWGAKLVFHLTTLAGWAVGGMLAAGLAGFTQRAR